MPEPRILLWDVENSPSKGYYYDRWRENNIIKETEPWFMLSYAYQWLGEDEIHVRALCDYPGYRRNKRCDRNLVQDLRDLLSTADIAIAHNGDRHDTRKVNARIAYHGLDPTSPRRSIDTYKEAKKHFAFGANNLDHLANHLGIGRKLPTTGFEMHERCMEGDPTAWPIMKDYNKHDVFLLGGVYIRLRPFMTTHPRLTNYTKDNACPACLSNNVQHRGQEVTKTGHRQRFQCQDCSKWFSGLKHVKDVPPVLR